MTGLEPREDQVVRDAVDAYLDGPLGGRFQGEMVFETKNSRYRLVDGTLFSAPDSSLVGAELVGWFIESPTPIVDLAWKPGVRAVLVDRNRGRHIIVTSGTRALQMDAPVIDRPIAGSTPPPAQMTPIPHPPPIPAARRVAPHLPPRPVAQASPPRAAHHTSPSAGPAPLPPPGGYVLPPIQPPPMRAATVYPPPHDDGDDDLTVTQENERPLPLVVRRTLPSATAAAPDAAANGANPPAPLAVALAPDVAADVPKPPAPPEVALAHAATATSPKAPAPLAVALASDAAADVPVAPAPPEVALAPDAAGTSPDAPAPPEPSPAHAVTNDSNPPEPALDATAGSPKFSTPRGVQRGALLRALLR